MVWCRHLTRPEKPDTELMRPFCSPRPDSPVEMLPVVCGGPSKANTGAGAAVVYELVAKSFRGAASKAVPGPAVCSSNAAATGTWLRRGVITGAMRVCGFTPSLFPTRSCSQQRSCPQPRVWAELHSHHLENTFICKPRVFPSQDGSQSQGCCASCREVL